MANHGKISSLPADIREKLHRRICDNEPPLDTLTWLNALPVVRAVLADYFQGRPITSDNLSEYKHHGAYRHWFDSCAAHELALSLHDPQAATDPLLAHFSPEHLNRWLLIQFTARANQIYAETDPKNLWPRLCQLLAGVSRLRRDNVHQDRLCLDQKRLALQQAQAQQHSEEAHEAWTKRPEVRAKLYRGLAPDTMALIDRDRGVAPLPENPHPPGPTP